MCSLRGELVKSRKSAKDTYSFREKRGECSVFMMDSHLPAASWSDAKGEGGLCLALEFKTTSQLFVCVELPSVGPVRLWRTSAGMWKFGNQTLVKAKRKALQRFHTIESHRRLPTEGLAGSVSDAHGFVRKRCRCRVLGGV